MATILAIEGDHPTNPSEDSDIALALQQAAHAQKEAKKWLDQNKGDLLRGMDKSATGQGPGRHASSEEDSGSRRSLRQKSCPSQLFVKKGDKAGAGTNGNKGGGCFSKGATPTDVTPFSSSSHSSFPREPGLVAPMAPKNLLIFVSFSMPEASLKSLSQEAQKQGAVLVMRGLYRDSFVQTAQKLQKLGIAVDIHPELFEAHHIVSVPTFIKIDNGRPLYSLKGNVTLDFALKKFGPPLGNQLVGEQPVRNQRTNAQRTKEAP